MSWPVVVLSDGRRAVHVGDKTSACLVGQLSESQRRRGRRHRAVLGLGTLIAIIVLLDQLVCGRWWPGQTSSASSRPVQRSRHVAVLVGTSVAPGRMVQRAVMPRLGEAFNLVVRAITRLPRLR